MKLSVIKYK